MEVLVNQKRIEEKINFLSTIIDENAPGYTRRPFTKWNMACRDWLIKEMKRNNVLVEIDASSNIVGTLLGKNEKLAPIMIGSHTDSVIGGGMFDGTIGVIAALEIIESLKENNIQLDHTLKIVDFTAEEATEFGLATIGSRGMVGNLSNIELNRINYEGKTLRDLLRSIGGNPEKIKEKALKKGDISLFLELHIEQGPLLEQTNNELGIVTGFVGIERYRVAVSGQPNHAGTTPMNMRFDALVAAADLVIKIEEICKDPYDTPVVGTVGRLNVEPNAPNVIPGNVVFDFEIRAINEDVLKNVIQKVNKVIMDISRKREIKFDISNLSLAKPIKVHSNIVEGLEFCANKVGKTYRLQSGAGHDGVQISKIAPIGMIFVPSKDGKSHCPEEWTDYVLVTKGVQTLLNSLLYFDKKIETLNQKEVRH